MLCNPLYKLGILQFHYAFFIHIHTLVQRIGDKIVHFLIKAPNLVVYAKVTILKIGGTLKMP